MPRSARDACRPHIGLGTVFTTLEGEVPSLVCPTSRVTGGERVHLAATRNEGDTVCKPLVGHRLRGRWAPSAPTILNQRH